MRTRREARKGVTLVECAVIYPLAFLLAVGLVVGGMGMFRYQQMASLARETARYASVHGTLYARDAGTTAPTPQDIYNAVIVPGAVGLDLNRLSYSITYNTSNNPYHTTIVNGDIVATTNTVQVTLTYQWLPEALLGKTFSLSSTSQMIMTY
jgi:Flp pilus assembly protein TadG